MDTRKPSEAQINLLIKNVNRLRRQDSRPPISDAQEQGLRAEAAAKDRDWIGQSIDRLNEALGFSKQTSPASAEQLTKIRSLGGEALRGMTWAEARRYIQNLEVGRAFKPVLDHQQAPLVPAEEALRPPAVPDTVASVPDYDAIIAELAAELNQGL